MKVTNKFNLPAPFLFAVEHDEYSRPTKHSATSLIKSPQMRQLEALHDKEIVIDVSDRIWILLGKGVHHVLERSLQKALEHYVGRYRSPMDHLAEERLTSQPVSGAIDYQNEGGIICIWDWKCTSIYAVKDGVKPEWEAQLNIYSWLYHACKGKRPDHLRICAILRDWSRRHRSPETPCPVKVLEVPQWPVKAQVEFVQARLRLHEDAEEVVNQSPGTEAEELARLFPCSDEERWAKPAKWAVMKKGRKRAVKLFDSWLAADAYAEPVGGKGHYVEERPATYPRCEDYCLASPFCHQFQHRHEKEV